MTRDSQWKFSSVLQTSHVSIWVKSPQITLSFWKGQANLESDWPTFRYSLLSCSAASFSVSAARLAAALFFVQRNSCWSQNYLSPTKKAPCFLLKSTTNLFSCCIAQHVVASLSRHHWKEADYEIFFRPAETFCLARLLRMTHIHVSLWDLFLPLNWVQSWIFFASAPPQWE